MQARVFRINDENVAVYFGGSYSPSAIKQTHFSGMSGTDVSIDKSVSTNVGGEFGVLFRAPKVGIRFSVELIKPGTITKATGVDATNTKLYDFESSISAVVPKVGLELNLKSMPVSRSYFHVSGGTATATYKNSYTLTADGQTAFPGLADFSDEGTGTAILYDAGISYETLMNDTTTVSITLGYRQLKILGYKHKADITNFSGAHLAKDEVLNEDSTAVTSDFSGAFASILFRFYLGK